jgi:hypothetical protein
MGLQSFQTGARLSDRFGFRYWQEARWSPGRPQGPPPSPLEGGARLTGRLKGLAGRLEPMRACLRLKGLLETIGRKADHFALLKFGVL